MMGVVLLLSIVSEVLGGLARHDGKAFRAECRRRAAFCVWAANGSNSPAHVFQSCVLDLCAKCSYPEDFK